MTTATIEKPSFPRMTWEDLRSAIIEVICELDDSEIFELHNHFCLKEKYFDDFVSPMAHFWEELAEMKPEDAFRLNKRDFNPTDPWYKWDGYGDPVSIFSPTSAQSPVDFGAIAECMIDNDDDFGDGDVRELLDHWNAWQEYDADVFAALLKNPAA